MLDKNKKYLVSSSRIVSPDGRNCDAVYGNAEIINSAEFLQLECTDPKSAFFIKVTNGEKVVWIPGDSFLGAIQCDNLPDKFPEDVKDDYRFKPEIYII